MKRTPRHLKLATLAALTAAARARAQIIFAVEAGLKIIVQGLLLHPGAYLRQGWNRLDGVIAIAGVLSVCLARSSKKSAKLS